MTWSLPSFLAKTLSSFGEPPTLHHYCCRGFVPSACPTQQKASPPCLPFQLKCHLLQEAFPGPIDFQRPLSLQ